MGDVLKRLKKIEEKGKKKAESSGKKTTTASERFNNAAAEEQAKWAAQGKVVNKGIFAPTSGKTSFSSIAVNPSSITPSTGRNASAPSASAVDKYRQQAREERVKILEEKIKNTKDRRQRAAYNQQFMNAKYPYLLHGKDANLSYSDKLEIKKAKDLWYQADQLEKKYGKSDETDEFKRRANSMADKVRLRNGYAYMEDGKTEYVPELTAREKLLPAEGQENVRTAKLYYEYAKRNGDEDLMKWAQDEIKKLNTSFSGGVRSTYVDRYDTDRMYLWSEVVKAKAEVKKAQNALRNYSSTISGTATFSQGNNQTLATLQENLRKKQDLLKEAERRVERLDYAEKANAKNYAETGNKWDDFWSQFGANKDLGRISQDASIAYNEYLKNPTPANRGFAEAMSDIEKSFQERNAAVLDDKGQVLPWLSDSLAGYLPQFADQFSSSAKGAAVGALAGAGVGFAAGGVGAIPGAVWGGRAGIVAGSGKYSYDTMRGAAFRSLIESGVDEETARKAANDEAVISSMIEMADTGIDVMTFGIGSALKAAGKTATKHATKSAGKKLASALGKYGVNIVGEMAEEGSQEAVSIANEQRVNDPNANLTLWELAKESVKTGKGAITGQNDPAAERMKEAAIEGGKIAAIMGGAGTVTREAATRGINKAYSTLSDTRSDKDLGKIIKDQGNEAVQSLVREGSQREDAAQIASSVSKKIQSGKTPSDAEVGKLARVLRSGNDRMDGSTSSRVNDFMEGGETLEGERKISPAKSSLLTDTSEDAVVAEMREIDSNGTKTGQGKSVQLRRISNENARVQSEEFQTKAIGNMARNLGENGAKAIAHAWDKSGDAIQYASDFARVYNRAVSGASIDQINPGSLTESQTMSAFYSGRNDRRISLDKAIDTADTAMVEQKRFGLYAKQNKTGSGLVRDEYVKRYMSVESAEQISTVAKQLGLRVEMVDSVAGGIANAEITGNLVKIEKGNPNPVRALFGHEMTHRVQELAPESYRQFRDYVMKSERAQADVLQKIEDYRSQGIELDSETAMDEIAADYAGQMIEDHNLLNEFIRQNNKNKSLLSRFAEAIRNMARKLTGKFRKQAEDAASLLEKAVADATKQADKLRKEGKVGTETEERFSIKSEKQIGEESASFEENGKRYSIKSLRNDISEGKMFDDLVASGVLNKAQATRLKNNLDGLIQYMLPNARILDMNEEYGKGNRPYKAYKPNSDPLYKISLDFSTLCRKRLMTQYVIEQLQLRENRPMTAEEQIAIRSMLLDYRKQENALQVACAMCYVEAARLKSPKQMNNYFNNTESILTKYFATKNKEFAASVKKAQEEFKVSHGYKANATKDDMTGSHRKSFDQMSDQMRKGYKPSEEERAIIEKAKSLPKETYLTAENLTSLSVKHPEIYDAYTTYIRNATRSKALESDIPYYYGDSLESVTDRFIENVNAENGMRFDSWSDFQMKHMLDMITAVIDLSVRGAKMHGYTKFPEMVRIFGKTGMQFNLSGVTEGNGFDADGNLVFSSVEGMDKDEAIQLRKDFPETAGFQCIGVSDEHIRALLRSDYVDYVIPYHISGLNKTMRRMAGIYKWDDYTKTQHANKDPNAKKQDGATNWQVEPVWSEFFVKDGKNGLDCMKKTAQKYIDMCHERGLIPKFNDFIEEENYWKLLIDRKMINQKNGKLIEQKPVKPDFDFDLIKREIDREVSSYDPGLERRALDYVVSNFDAVNTRIKELKKQGTLINKKQKTRKQMKTLGNEILQAYAQGVDNERKKYSLKGADDQNLVEKYDDLPKPVKKSRKPGTAEEQAFADDMYYGKKLHGLRNRNEEKMDDLREKNRERVSEVRAQNRERISDLKEQNRERISEIREKEREKRKEAVQKAKSDQKERDDAKYQKRIEKKDQKIKDIIEKNREKIAALKEKNREEKAEAVGKVKDHYKTKEEKAREARKAREIREKIVRHTGTLSDMLLNPTDKHHIPENLRGLVATMLDAVNQESSYSYDPNTIRVVVRKDGKNGGITGKRVKAGEGTPTKRTAAFEELRKKYQEILDGKDTSGDMVIDPDIVSVLDNVTSLRDTPISSMNSTQLSMVLDAVKAVEQTVRTAGKILSEAKFVRTSEWAEAIQRDCATRKKMKGRKIEKFRLDMENPYTFFSHYGESGKAIFRMLRDAQDKQQIMVEEIAEKVGEIVDKKQVKEWEKEVHTITTERGEELVLTSAHCMEIYLLTKRAQAMEHLLVGGIVQPEVQKKHIKRGTDSIQLTGEDLSAICGELTDEQTQVADRLQNLTSTLLADYGNEASMQAYGYKKFTGEDYWPIRSAREGLHSNIENGGNNTRSIKNIGMAKNTVPHANNPLDISGVFETFSRHAGDMSDYAAWLCPMEDAQRIFNYQFRDENGEKTGKTMKGLLDRIGGDQAQDYWFNLMEDIQNGLSSRNDSAILGPISKVYGNVKGASVGANLRVILQQPTAVIRAAAILNPADMVAGLASVGGWKRALEHSAIAKRKDMGGFDISSPMQLQEILFDKKGKVRRFNDAMMWGAGKADAVTWGKIWAACEITTKRKHKDLEPKSDAFYEEVNRLFTEVIDQSQVVDGVLQRSQNMRSNNAILKQATAFMGEPIMSLNMLIRSYDALVHETDKSKRGKAFKVFGRTAVALLVTNVVNALAQSLVDAARDDDKDDKYKKRFMTAFTGVEGDEETTWEKAVNVVLSGNLVNNVNPIGYIPIAKDLLSLLQGFDVNRADADVMDKIMTASKSFIDSLQEDGQKTIPYATMNLAKQIGKAFGVSAPNILRDVWSIARSIAIETDNYIVMFEMEKAIYKLGEKNKGRFVDILYNAYKNDTTAYKQIYNEMVKAGIPEDKIRSAMDKKLMDDAGVDSVEDLDDRYLSPTDKKKYDAYMKNLKGSDLWGEATKDQRDKAKARAYKAAQGKLEESTMEKIKEGSEYGIDDADYILYQLALAVADQPSESGKLGSYTNSERYEAISSTGLSDREKAYLWYMGLADNARSDEPFDALSAGVSMDTYMAFKAFSADVSADKDANGKSISGSKKAKIVDWMNQHNVGQTAFNFFYYDVMGYKK